MKEDVQTTEAVLFNLFTKIRLIRELDYTNPVV